MRRRLIYLIGYMAVGKTTLGRALGEVAGVRFVDLDAEIERRAAMSVSEIFAGLGEAEFRRLEAAALERIARCESDCATVVACGGGTPCRDASMQLMLDTGTVVWLKADTDRVVSRLLDAPDVRPRIDALRADPDALRHFVLEEGCVRDRYYSRAHHTFDSTRLDTLDEVAETVQRFIKQFDIK